LEEQQGQRQLEMAYSPQVKVKLSLQMKASLSFLKTLPSQQKSGTGFQNAPGSHGWHEMGAKEGGWYRPLWGSSVVMGPGEGWFGWFGLTREVANELEDDPA
jgi:hypothetical protein